MDHSAPEQWLPAGSDAGKGRGAGNGQRSLTRGGAEFTRQRAADQQPQLQISEGGERNGPESLVRA